MLAFSFLSLFPETLKPFLESSLLGKAQASGRVSFRTYQIRDFSQDKHRTVDDTPYGGGEGMLLKVDVLARAWEAAQADAQAAVAASGAAPEPREAEAPPLRRRTIFLSPQGPRLTQETAKRLARDYDHLTLVCGHYEGVDERFIELFVDEELSIGDYVLTGGELPALVVADAVARLLPGVVGNEDSVSRDSLEGGVLKYPQYTRPREFRGLEVPAVLMSGDHGAIAQWRAQQSRERTQRKRPDLKGTP